MEVFADENKNTLRADSRATTGGECMTYAELLETIGKAMARVAQHQTDAAMELLWDVQKGIKDAGELLKDAEYTLTRMECNGLTLEIIREYLA